jgi:hypothetical protein
LGLGNGETRPYQQLAEIDAVHGHGGDWTAVGACGCQFDIGRARTKKFRGQILGCFTALPAIAATFAQLAAFEGVDA